MVLGSRPERRTVSGKTYRGAVEVSLSQWTDVHRSHRETELEELGIVKLFTD